MQLKTFLAAFDFDYTIINDNSDVVVCKLLQHIPESIDNLRKSHGWTHYMDEVFKLLYESKVTESEIKKAVISIPPVPNTIELLQNLKRMDCEVIIISDANTFFIDEWLKAHDVKDCVHKVYSNPAEFKSGRLFMQGYHDQDWCRLSAKNMCKGHLLFDYIGERENFGTLFRYLSYCGDGKNDFCPSFRLRTNDIVFPRKNFCLDKLLSKTKKIKAQIIPWEETSTIINALEQLSSRN